MEREQPEQTEDAIRPITPDDAKPADDVDVPQPDDVSDDHVIEDPDRQSGGREQP